MVSAAGARVPKYEHRFAEAYKLSEQEVAVMCVLMLRGHQTTGEIRGRSSRLYEFRELEEVELTLQSLTDSNLVVKLPRQPGTKESRYAHVLSGEIHVEEREAAPRKLEAATLEVMAENERMAKLEGRVEQLEVDLSELKQQLLDFKRQFE
jgi:uncharacterized protein YceH (UPF0502 family)